MTQFDDSDDESNDEADTEDKDVTTTSGHVSFKPSMTQKMRMIRALVSHLEVFAKIKIPKDSKLMPQLKELYLNLLSSDAADLRKVCALPKLTFLILWSEKLLSTL